MPRKTSHSGTVVAQGAHLRDTNLSKAGALPKTFWHSWRSSASLGEADYHDLSFGDEVIQSQGLRVMLVFTPPWSGFICSRSKRPLTCSRAETGYRGSVAFRRSA